MLTIVGLNHKSASLVLREQAAFVPDQLPEALRQCQALPGVREVMILSTCNRTEIAAIAGDPEQLVQWLVDWCQAPLTDIQAASYCFQGRQAVQHLMRVACGLDSAILGEPQVFGQLKQAFQLAQEVGSIGKKLHKCCQAVFSAGKQVRTDTQIGASPVSLAFAVVKQVQQIFSDLSDLSVVFIGAGQMTQLIAQHLHSQGVKQFVIANRSLERAERLAEGLKGKAITIGEVPKWLPHADMIISATTTQLPVLGKGTIERACKHRKHRQLFIADLAMPRDVEPEVGELPDIYLYNIDDLQKVVAHSKLGREEAAILAEKMVTDAAERFIVEAEAIDAVASIREFRRQVEIYRDEEIDRALGALAQGHAPDAVLMRTMRLLVNKILHQPTIQLRRAAQKRQHEVIKLAKTLFEQA